MLRVKELLDERGMTAKELAEKMGISAPAFSLSLSGNPTLERLESIASALNVPIIELFEKQTDFVAFVRENGEIKCFDTKKKLEEYINK